MLGRSRLLLLILAGLLASGSTVEGQQIVPPPDSPSVTTATLPSDRLEAIEARLRVLEDQNRQLSEENQELRRLIGTTPGTSEAEATPPVTDHQVMGTQSLADLVGDLPGPIPVLIDGTSPTRGGTTFSSTPDSPVPSYMSADPGRPGDRVPILGSFGQGFQFQSEDEEYMLQIHLESQTDYRGFDPAGDPAFRDLAVDGIYSPRNRIFFGGRATRNVEYLLSINKGFSDLNLLDAWLNFRDGDRLQLKLGRIMTPFNYEQFAIQNMWLIAPERSLFTSNLGLNRQLGAMLWGSAFDEQVDYAVGIFNGPRNSFEDFNSSKDILTYLNIRPFQDQDEGSLFRFLNFGGSFSYGDQNNPLIPGAFRLATNASNAGTADRAAPPFLVFNDGVIERGQRAFWSAHLAYFYRSLSLVADYNGAILRYASSQASARSAVLPTHGMSIGAGYFLTGEQVERRALVEPLRPMNLRRGAFSPGAIELIGRYSTFDVDSSIFEAGLADPERWSNRAWITNLGVNWYPNRYLKILLTWQHAEFGSPVFYAEPNRRSLTNEMLWLRCQFYY